MLHWILVIVGLLLGAAMTTGGAVWGALCGYLLAESIGARRRIKRLETLISQRSADTRSPFRNAPPEQEQDRSVGPVEAPVFEEALSDDLPVNIALKVQAEAPDASSVHKKADHAETENITQHKSVKESAAPKPVDSFLNRCFKALFRFFTEGNPLVRIGIVVFLIGTGLLVKFIGQQIDIPIGVRLLGVAAAGLGLLALGIVYRLKRPAFALPLQGGGLGTLFLTIYAALQLYQLLSAPIAFALLVLLVCLTIFLAVKQDSRILAMFGVAGGFIAPIVSSTGQGSHVALFSYYLILNGVIFAVAWFRSWQLLNWLGFVSTFAIGMVWGAQYYEPQYFQSVEPFLILHVALYIAVAILFASKQPIRLKGLVDGTIVFGTPVIGFTNQAALLSDSRYGLAISAAVFGVVYLSISALLARKDKSTYRLLTQCFTALGLGFLTLSIPLAFDARVTSAMWVLEGAAVAWVGIRQHRRLASLAGQALMVLGSFAFLLEAPRRGEQLLFFNANFLGVLLIVVAFGFIAHILYRESQNRSRWLDTAFWSYGLLWWLVGSFAEIDWHLDQNPRLLTVVILLSSSVVLNYYYARFLQSRLRMATTYLLTLLAFPLCLWLSTDDWSPLALNANAISVVTCCAVAVWLGWNLLREACWYQDTRPSDLLAGLALAFWLLAGWQQLESYLPDVSAIYAFLVWVSVSLLAGYSLGNLLNWPIWHRCLAVLIVVPALFLLGMLVTGVSIFAKESIAGWLLVFAVIYGLLKKQREPEAAALAIQHHIALLSLLAVASFGIQEWAAADLGSQTATAISSWISMPLVYWLVVRTQGLASRWPIVELPQVYREVGLIPLMMGIGLWAMLSAFSQPPVFAIFDYFPVLNVLDLSALIGLCVIADWLAVQDRLRQDWHRLGAVLLGVIAFVTINAVLLRALYYWWDVPYQVEAIWASYTAQSAMTILWVVTGLTMMLTGSLRSLRTLWIVGVSLMGIAVLKLFAVDLAGSGTLARIMAFFGVAVGFLIAGFFAPRPPSNDVSDPESETPPGQQKSPA